MSSNSQYNLREQLAQAGEQVRAENEAQQTQRSTPSESGSPSKPHRRGRRYDQMRRIEGRLHPRQLNELNSLTLKLGDQRSPDRYRERITNNTLLRVAVDVLLKHQRGLKGNTEDELRESLLSYLAQHPDSQ